MDSVAALMQALTPVDKRNVSGCCILSIFCCVDAERETCTHDDTVLEFVFIGLFIIILQTIWGKFGFINLSLQHSKHSHWPDQWQLAKTLTLPKIMISWQTQTLLRNIQGVNLYGLWPLTLCSVIQRLLKVLKTYFPHQLLESTQIPLNLIYRYCYVILSKKWRIYHFYSNFWVSAVIWAPAWLYIAHSHQAGVI